MFSKLFKRFFKQTFSIIERNKSLKIESIEEDKETGLLYLVVKINGKCTPPISKDPCKLVFENSSENSNLFSKDDYSSIIGTMLENQKRIIEKKHKKNHLFIKHNFSEQTGEPLVFYQNISTNQHHIKSAKEIFTDANLINNFNSQDSACIGNLVGCFEMEKELNLLHPEWAKQLQAKEVIEKLKLKLKIL